MKKVRLKDVTTKIGSGATPRGGKNSYKNEGTSLIRSLNVYDLEFDKSGLAFIDDEQAEGLSNVTVEPNDVLLNITGASVARCCKVPKDILPARVNQHVSILRSDITELNPDYLQYLLVSPSYKHKLLTYAQVGATREALTKGGIEDFEIDLPPIETQQKIASILSAFDDLIENNTQRIAILEEMARLIYREWFVHYRYPGHENDQLEDSGTELGDVPEGWELKALEDFGRIETGKTPPKKDPKNYGNYMPFIKTPDMHGKLFIHESSESLSLKGVKTQKNKTLPSNSLIVNCIGAGAGVVSITTKESHTNQQINAIILDCLIDREFLYLSLVYLRPKLRKVGSSGATMINVSKGKFQALEVLWPGDDLVQTYHEKVDSMFDQIQVLQKQNLRLKETRDLLLPKLISGEVEG